MFENFTLVDIINIILRRIVLILICAAVFATASYVYTANFITKKYTSEISLYLHNVTQQSTIQSDLTALSFVSNLKETYQLLMKSDNVLNAVAEKSGLDYTPEQIARMTSLSFANEDALILNLKVTCSSPEDAFILAQTYGDASPEALNEIVPGATSKTVNEAELPSVPSYPSKRNNAILGFLIGFALPTILVVLIEIFRISITDADQLTARYNVPVIGNVPTLDQ